MEFKPYYLIIIICTLFSSCSTSLYTYNKPAEINDGLVTGLLKETNIDSNKIYRLVNEILDNKYINMHSLLISRNNKLVFEKYFNGHDKHKTHFLASAGKSIVSALVGIAIDKGYIKNSDEKLLKFFKYYPVIKHWDKRKGKINIKHLLTMSAGLDCGNIMDYTNHCGFLMNKYPDPIKYLLDLPMTHNPGEFFLYNDGTPVLLQAIIGLTSQTDIAMFQQKYLEEPLKIKHEEETFNFSSRDMMKFGLLYLNKGIWGNKRIISKEWIEESTQVYMRNLNINIDGYGYFWWVRTFEVNSKKYRSFYAAGNGGQYIFIIPDLETVVVFTGGNYGNLNESRKVFTMMSNYIIPSIRL